MDRSIIACSNWEYMRVNLHKVGQISLNPLLKIVEIIRWVLWIVHNVGLNSYLERSNNYIATVDTAWKWSNIVIYRTFELVKITLLQTKEPNS